MTSVETGQPAPDFTLPATGGQEVTLSELKGNNVVLYFYPRDNTPGCTREGEAFRDHHGELQKLGAVVLGISRDSVKSHENFRAKHRFPFQLLSDSDETVCRSYGVIKEKNMYGRKVMGIERSTFLIDREGILRRQWRKVKVAGHVEDVLEALRSI